MSSVPSPSDIYFTFDTTHHALWAEEVAGEVGVPVEVVPAPPQSRAKCDLSIRTRSTHAPALRSAFGEEGIVFREYGEGTTI